MSDRMRDGSAAGSCLRGVFLNSIHLMLTGILVVRGVRGCNDRGVTSSATELTLWFKCRQPWEVRAPKK